MAKRKGDTNKTAREKDMEAKLATKEAMYKRRIARKNEEVASLKEKLRKKS
jgi:hypothetical protein